MKGQKWPTFTPPATTQCRRYRGRVLLRRLHVGADRALRNLGDTVASVDDEIPPLRQPEEFMFGDFRWPHRNHWDQWAWSIERIAEACCAKVRFTEKYDYLQVEITEKPSSKQQDRALQELANYVELISDYEILTTC